MRSYLVEDLFNGDAKRIEESLKAKDFSGPMDGLFYLPVPQEMLQGLQREHLPECGPYMMALEVNYGVEKANLKLELLVRARNNLRCDCIAYAGPELRAYMIDFLDDFIKEQDVSV